jgi:hypothetical protein
VIDGRSRSGDEAGDRDARLLVAACGGPATRLVRIGFPL